MRQKLLCDRRRLGGHRKHERHQHRREAERGQRQRAPLEQQRPQRQPKDRGVHRARPGRGHAGRRTRSRGRRRPARPAPAGSRRAADTGSSRLKRSTSAVSTHRPRQPRWPSRPRRAHQLARQLAPVAAGRDPHAARPVGDQRADRQRLALGHQMAVDQHQHPGRHALDLVQHVGGDDHRLALLAQPPQQVDHVSPLGGVEAVQGLVQQQQVGLVGERLGELDALAHARARSHRPRGRRRHSARPPPAHGRRRRADRRTRAGGRTARPPRAPSETATAGCGRARSRPAGRPRGRGAGSIPNTRTLPARGEAKPPHSLSAVDLPAPLWPSRPVTPGADGERDVGDRDRVAVPVGHPSNSITGAPSLIPPPGSARRSRARRHRDHDE